MPLGKYYCDYCEKQFQDTAAARKRHLQSAQHQRARVLWYDAVHHQESQGGASSLLQPDGALLSQGVCHHFARTYFADFSLVHMFKPSPSRCDMQVWLFGDSCRYFHPKPHAVNPALPPSGPGPGAMMQQSNFLGSQPNFVRYEAVEGNSFSGNILGAHTSWSNLPPSLQPPPEGG